MATIISTLYPPLLDTFMPAFQYDGPAKVTFSISPYNDINSIKKIHISLVNQKTNQSALKNNSSTLSRVDLWNSILLNGIWIVPFSVSGNEFLTVDEKNKICELTIPKILLKTDDSNNNFSIKHYYKLQIRLDESPIEIIRDDNDNYNVTSTYLTDNRHFFSEWSSVCLLKAIPHIELGLTSFDIQTIDINQLEDPNKTPWTVQPGIVPISGEINTVPEDLEENIQKFRITIYNTKDDKYELIDDSNWVYNLENKNEIYWLADVTNCLQNELLEVNVEIVTKNQFNFSKKYYLRISNYSTITFKPIWNFKKITLNEFNEKSTQIVTEEDGMVEFSIRTNEDLPTGFLYVKRASSLDNFKSWELISCTKNSGKINKTFIDPTVGSLIKYRYSCQYQIATTLMWTDTKYSQENDKDIYVYPNFYDALIYRQGKQLAIRYNTQIQTLSPVVNRQIINTLGGKYPKFAENAKMNYKKFSISGLITAESDFNRTFINDRDYADQMQDYDKYMNGKYEIRNDTIADDTNTYSQNIVDYPNTRSATEHLVNNLHDLYPKDNWWLERKFREEALEWLNDGEPKLFRSMTEGNIVVLLTDITLNPNIQLGRRTYNLSATAYEIGDGYSLNTLSSLGIINVPNDYWEFFNLGMAFSEKDDDDTENGVIQVATVGQLFQRQAKDNGGTSLVQEVTELINTPNVQDYTINDYYTGLFYQGINHDYKIKKESYRLTDLKIQFESKPQWYTINEKTIELKTNNLIDNNASLGYKLQLKINQNPILIFVGEKGYYQIPSNLKVSEITIFDNAIATLDYKIAYACDYDESSIAIEGQIIKKILGQVSGNWYPNQTVVEIIKKKYEYYELNNGKSGSNVPDILEQQYLEKITSINFDGTSYAVLGIQFVDSGEIKPFLIGRSGIYDLKTDSPIEEIIILGRRLFKKEIENYQEKLYEGVFFWDESAAEYENNLDQNLNWYAWNNNMALNVLAVLNGFVSEPVQYQIIKKWSDSSQISPYTNVNDIINPKINTIYGIENNGELKLMVKDSNENWNNITFDVIRDGIIMNIISNKKKKSFIKKKNIFLDEWEFALDESARDDISTNLYWYKEYLGQLNIPVIINSTNDINNAIYHINEEKTIPIIDGYNSISDIKNPEYNIVYGFKNNNNEDVPKKYKIYYINGQWYDIDFVEGTNKDIILAKVPISGMINYQGDMVQKRWR